MADDRVSRKCHELLTVRYAGSVAKVADLCGETENWVYQNINGRTRCPHVKILRAAYIVTGDPFFKRELEPQGYELNPANTAASLRDPESELSDVFVAASKALEEVRKALEDNEIDRGEDARISTAFRNIKQQLIEAELSYQSVAGTKLKAVK